MDASFRSRDVIESALLAGHRRHVITGRRYENPIKHSKRLFVFILIASIIVAVALPIMVSHNRPESGILIAPIYLVLTLLTVAAYDPQRFWVIWRIIAVCLFIGLSIGFVQQLIGSADPTESAVPSRSPLRNIALYLITGGVCGFYAVTGQISPAHWWSLPKESARDWFGW